MLTVDQAIEAILKRARPLPPRSTPLIEALGLTLAEDIAADIDLPPFEKALMDGYAVRSVDLAEPGEHRLRIAEEILAGRMSTRPLLANEAARIMTGAPLPPGSDAVVMVEKTTCPDESTVLLSGPIAPGLNRMPRGREMKAGEPLLTRGTRIDGVKLGLIASAGRHMVQAIPCPSVAIVPTGDELVPISQSPGPGQIRNTNGIMLAGMARAWGARQVHESPVAPDEPVGLRASLDDALGSDVLIVSGGVSAGTKDLVPSTLVDLGVESVFHKVQVKPGKPIWFGVGPSGTMVFGLPGNPVSGVVGFLLFVRPALDALAGRLPKRTQLASFRLARPFHHRGDRPTYHPSRLEDGRLLPLDWAGSADLRTVALAEGFAAFPSGDRAYREGEEVAFLPMI